jgi:hypothetical protein
VAVGAVVSVRGHGFLPVAFASSDSCDEGIRRSTQPVASELGLTVLSLAGPPCQSVEAEVALSCPVHVLNIIDREGETWGTTQNSFSIPLIIIIIIIIKRQNFRFFFFVHPFVWSVFL